MALTDGFFNAVLTEGNYDRLYNADQHVEYYSHMIGSGVSIAGNVNSCKVSFANGVATVATGFLFIDGYWLKIDSAYNITMPGTGTYAILARLDVTARAIVLTYSAMANAYANSLCLAYVNVDTGMVTDCREDVSLCGIVDTAAATATKAKYAADYIENDVETRLSTAEQTIQSEISEMETKISETEEIVDSIGYPAVGELKFSAGTMSNKWLRCQGQYISASQYPELVEALGYTTITNELTNRYTSNVGAYISNGAVLNGYLYFAAWATKTLIGIPLTSTGAMKTFSLSSYLKATTSFVNPTAKNPLCLTLSNGYIFIVQGYQYLAGTFDGETLNLLSEASLRGESTDINVIYRYVHVDTEKGHWYYAGGLQLVSQEGGIYAPIYYDCKVLPFAGTIDSYYSFSSKTGQGVIRSSYTGIKPAIAYREENQGVSIVSRIIKDVSNKSQSYFLFSELENIYEDVAAVTIQNENVSTDSEYLAALPVINDQYVISGAYIKNKHLLVYAFDVVNDSGAIIYLEDRTLPSAANVFLESCVYANGLFFIYVGTGLYVTADPTDADAYSFIDLSTAIGTVSRFGGIYYDSVNDQLIIHGIKTTGAVTVQTVDLTGFRASDTGVYLPTLAKANIPGYIKAVSG